MVKYLLLIELQIGVIAFSQNVSPSRMAAEAGEAPTLSAQTPPDYVLGPNDELVVTVPNLDELSNRAARIALSGDLTLPLAGRIHAAQLTTEQLESRINERLKPFIKNPDAVVSISEFRSQPISVLGAVGNPGVRQLQGEKRLFEVLSEAGGLRTDAGNTVWITRNLSWGQVPLPLAKDDSTGHFSVASIGTRDITSPSNPAENILIKPGDVIAVSKEEVVYCVGSIKKPGGFVLGENRGLSALQVLALAGGLDKDSAPDRAKILRPVPGSSDRSEISVNLKKLMAGKTTDLPLQANDILFVPSSAVKTVASRTLEAIVQTASGVAIYGRY